MHDDQPVIATTIADLTYQRLRRDIVSGALLPGSKLGMDLLTSRYDVGMSPLREALMRLTGDALVVTESQRGFWVSDITLDELEDTMRTRVLVESEALERSIMLGGDAWEQAVRESYEQLSELEASLAKADDAIVSQWERANEAFHDALVSACNSPWLVRMRTMLHQHAERYRRISLANTVAGRDVHDEHEAIYRAAIDRKALRACHLIELHVNGTTAAVRAVLQANPALTAQGGASKAKRRKS
jgi:GntR family transcriptional regulator, carbon starvation induced regulator